MYAEVGDATHELDVVVGGIVLFEFDALGGSISGEGIGAQLGE